MKCFANTLFAEALLLSSMAREEQSVGYRAGQRLRSVKQSAPRGEQPRY